MYFCTSKASTFCTSEASLHLASTLSTLLPAYCRGSMPRDLHVSMRTFVLGSKYFCTSKQELVSKAPGGDKCTAASAPVRQSTPTLSMPFGKTCTFVLGRKYFCASKQVLLCYGKHLAATRALRQCASRRRRCLCLSEGFSRRLRGAAGLEAASSPAASS